ncbi:RICIN domain-containing protein [Leifsonia shinshuensis]|uniref:RICIN domain-containing protein n=1 Tax=Leifsonia shinshuensis TaxID=150026 RepID=UPI001F50C6EC|nr:RICIN domain-containing protein [Leifsonia shinshuensis]MCI0159255.1 RICIN domain-containing protein [Leifsonia shinshuensis]
MTREPRPRRRFRAALIASAVGGLLAGILAGPAAVALWSAQVTVSGHVTAGQVAASADVAPQAVTFANGARTRAALVTISNTTSGPTTVPAGVRAELSVPSALDAGILATAWPVPAPADCTDDAVAPPDAVTGAWTDGLTVAGDPVAPGAQTYLCVQTTGSARAFGVTGGTQTFDPAVAVTLSVHGLSATATATATFTTQLIFPVSLWNDGRVQQIRPDRDRTLCLDVGATMGGPVSLAACQGSPSAPGPNQFFVWNTVAPDFSTLTAGRAAGGRVTIDPDGTLSTRDAGAAGVQTWQLQVQGTSIVQLVSESGLCWTAPAAAGPVTAAVCDGSAAQQWAFYLVSTGTTDTPGGTG